MGTQKSQEQSSMVSVLQPNQFTVLQARREWQLWEDRISTRRYMVFTLDDTSLSEHNLQIYHFRKLNRAYLSGVHALSQDEPGLCAQPNRTLLMLDDLPFTLADFGRTLALHEGLTVLQVALAGYRIMSYLFGPLMSSPDMICFTETGVPKVWANQQLQHNEPSPEAFRVDPVKAEDDRWVLPNLTVAEKKIKSIRSIVQTISTALRQPFPVDFLRHLDRVRSYEEAEEVLELFCRRQGIELQEWVEAGPIQEQKTLIPIASGTFLSRVASERPIAQSYVYNSPPLRGQYIDYAYNKPAQAIPSIPTAQPIFHKLPQNQFVIRSQNPSEGHVPSVPPPLVQYPYRPKALVTPQAVETETIITSFPFESQQRSAQPQLKPPPLKNARISADDRIIPQMVEQRQKPRVEIATVPPTKANEVVEQRHQPDQSEIPTRQEISSSEISQSSHQQCPQLQENYELVVHQITDSEHSQDNEQIIHDRTIEMEQVISHRVSTPEDGREEIDLWEESMQKAVKKVRSRQSSDNYRSEERDQVLLPESQYGPPEQNIADFKSEEELERYIRNKYSQYFTEKQPPKIPNLTHHHTSSLDKQLFEKKVAFAAEASAQEDEEEETSPIETGKFVTKPNFDSLKKYTFGNIEPDPSYASAQYQSALSKPSKEGIGIEEGRRRKKMDDDSINARYSKYVVNRSGKTLKQPTTSQFGRDRTESAGTYEDLRRLLRQ